MSVDDLPRSEGITRFDPDDYDDLKSLTVRRIVGLIDPEARCRAYSEILIMSDTRGLSICVNDDTDELIVTLVDAPPQDGRWVSVESLDDCLRREFGWTWSAMNSQGYWDLFAISFELVVPNVAFFGIASTIQVMRMNSVNPAASA
jgi:hypothetical protein